MLNNIKPPYLGAAYYPELWPLENIDHDIAQMKESGCNLMRIGEFAWLSMEPREGEYQFDWLHTVMDKLHKADIAVVLCTPSATPPQWLTNKYEQTLLLKHDGKRLRHGARRHNCPNSPVMREYNERIVIEMAKRFGKHPALVGWQIDNELYVYNPCHCPICVEKFRKWLKAEYKNIEALNDAWGMARWSLSYISFDTILPPLPDMWNHPTLHSKWIEFQGDSWISFAEEQVKIIKKYSSAPVGTDMMPMMGLSYYKMNAFMDVVQYNHYDNFDSLYKTPIWFDFLRCVKPDVPFWNTETQTCWNGAHSIAGGVRQEGFCRVNSWLPLAYGGEMNLYWLWKCHPNGHELMHGSVVSPSGQFLHMLSEVQACSNDFEKAASFLANTKVTASVALHRTYYSWLNFSYAPLKYNFDYLNSLFEKFYTPLTYEAHTQLDVIDTPAPLDKYKVLFSPFLPTIDEELKIKLEQFIENGGTWVVGPMSNVFDKDIKRYTYKTMPLIEDWADIHCKYQLPDDNNPYEITYNDGSKLEGSICYDGFEASGKKVLATYQSGPLKGLAAITRTPMGKGSIVVLGTVPKGDAMQALLQKLGIAPPLQASENVLAVPRNGKGINGLIIMEVKNKAGFIELPDEYVNILKDESVKGHIEIAPADVLVLVKK